MASVNGINNSNNMETSDQIADILNKLRQAGSEAKSDCLDSKNLIIALDHDLDGDGQTDRMTLTPTSDSFASETAHTYNLKVDYANPRANDVDSYLVTHFPVSKVAVSMDGRYLVIGGNNNETQTFDLDKFASPEMAPANEATGTATLDKKKNQVNISATDSGPNAGITSLSFYVNGKVQQTNTFESPRTEIRESLAIDRGIIESGASLYAKITDLDGNVTILDVQ